MDARLPNYRAPTRGVWQCALGSPSVSLFTLQIVAWFVTVFACVCSFSISKHWGLLLARAHRILSNNKIKSLSKGLFSKLGNLGSLWVSTCIYICIYIYVLTEYVLPIYVYMCICKLNRPYRNHQLRRCRDAQERNNVHESLFKICLTQPHKPRKTKKAHPGFSLTSLEKLKKPIQVSGSYLGLSWLCIQTIYLMQWVFLQRYLWKPDSSSSSWHIWRHSNLKFVSPCMFFATCLLHVHTHVQSCSQKTGKQRDGKPQNELLQKP